MKSLIAERREDQEKLLNQSLVHVPFDGWGRKSLLEAAKDLGMETLAALNAFPGGEAEMIALYSDLADRQMIQDYRNLEVKPTRISSKIEIMVQLRLQRQQSNKEAVRAAAGVLMNPRNLALATRLLYNSVDCIWRELGDPATDFNFYTKRGILAAIYSATFFYWLEDKSDGQWETWRFLERRLQDLGHIPGIKTRYKNLQGRLPKPSLLLGALRRKNTSFPKRA